ncbi:MAG: dUTPase [Phycisphaerae bacterium]|nr:dUTPase [Phycisphaerae bacterium]
MLEELFKYQAELNRRVGFDPEKLRRNFDPQVAGEWLNNYIAAASNELEELRNATYWKHWCTEAKTGHRFELHDLQNARVEVIDLLFFWISMAQCVGLSAGDVLELYMKKLKVNHDRQDGTYSMTDKTEEDNKGITLSRDAQSHRERISTDQPTPQG